MDQLKHDLLAQHDVSNPQRGRQVFRAFLETVIAELDAEPYSGLFADIENKLPQQHENTRIDPDVDVVALSEDPTQIERIYEELISREYRRENGQFFTPGIVAEFMAAQIPPNAQRVLDPTTGTGVFLPSIYSSSPEGQRTITAVDKDPLMLLAAYVRLSLCQSNTGETDFVNADFLTDADGCDSDSYDAIICNPPYNKFHSHDTSLIPTFESRFGIELGGLSNIYPLFFLRATELLAEDGLLIFITPGEFLDTRYGIGLKRFMHEQMNLELFISLDWDESVFNALTTATITVLRNAAPTDTVEFVRSTTPNELSEWIQSGKPIPEMLNSRTLSHTTLDPTQKWNRHFAEVDGQKYLDVTVPLSKLARTKRGIATGHNEFFTLSENEAREWEIEERFLVPVVSKATQAPNYTFRESDWNKLLRDGYDMFLLYCTDEPSENVRAYLEYGKQEYEAHERYLTSNRSPWYAPEQREPAPILATVFSRNNMRFVSNEYRVRNLAAFHCLYPKRSTKPEIQALLGFLNSETALELAKLQKRTYADGLSKFEPGDVSNLPALDIRRLDDETVSSLAESFERLDSARRTSDEQQLANAKQSLDSLVRDALDERLDSAWKESITHWT